MATRFSILIGCAGIAGSSAMGQFGGVEVRLPPEARPYCHTLTFSHGWTIPRLEPRTGQPLSLSTEASDYEFRAEGVVGTKFLVAAFTEFVGENNYTTNRYRVDLSDHAAPATLVDLKTWNAARVIPFYRKSAFRPGPVPNEKRLEFHSFTFEKTGEIWAQNFEAATHLSPDQALLVLQSTAPGNAGAPVKVFFDFFNSDTGRKLFTLSGAFSALYGVGDVDGVLDKTGWVSDRFFIIPLGRKLDRCLVCDFGKRDSRKGAKQ